MLEVSEVAARDMFAGQDVPYEGHELFYHTQEGECVGHVYAKREAEDIAYITHVEIDERFRGMGHGSKMMCESMEALIVITGFMRWELEV